MFRGLTTPEKAFTALFLLTAAIFAARGITTLCDGEYWQSTRGAPPVRYDGEKAKFLAWSQIATGLAFVGCFLSWRGRTGSLGWIPAIMAGMVSVLCYSLALLI